MRHASTWSVAGPAHPDTLGLSERTLEAEHPLKQAGLQLSHLADGVLVLEEDGSWDILDLNDQVLARIAMPRSSRVAIGSNSTRKAIATQQGDFPEPLARVRFRMVPLRT